MLAHIIVALKRRGIDAVAIPIQKAEKSDTVLGWCPVYADQKGNWKAKKVKSPPIYYNRIMGRRREGTEVVQKALERLQKNKKMYFNPRYLSKADIHCHLAESMLAKHIPETIIKPTPQDVIEALKNWPTVYLKPLESCQGRGIFRLEGCRYGWKAIGIQRMKMKKLYFQQDHKLLYWLSKLLQRRDYLSQQGIHLDKWRNRPYDLRVLVQKNEQGQWAYVGAGIRLAAPGHVVTHRPNGGQIVKPEKIMVRKFGYRGWKDKKKELAQLAEEAATTIEREYKSPFGLLTLDVACADCGKLWILEINSKPGSFDEGAIQRRSYDLLAAYIRHLQDQRREENEHIYTL
ncbi:YheC/YheD family endospore coat-associated protein [Heliorestis convoluta]|uniref:YheC/YheD family protein n=1 Tax=Heliorestis convoluta TaxID=356322 RepID=A0A5Q2MWU5_9FIRM|nr:YheC/YheD family protein [Heliorestis convoluta]QGG46877.1 YheC/YheD family protein [Heliorestis convoluta]